MLRKMRNAAKSHAPATRIPAARPSYLPEFSMPSKPDDRATTLKKIDEIEAQMSMQWWKTKHGSDSSVRKRRRQQQLSRCPPDVPPDALRHRPHAALLRLYAKRRRSPWWWIGPTSPSVSAAQLTPMALV